MSDTELGDLERSRLSAFIDAAKEKGVNDEFIVTLLKNKGWSERRIYGAFAQYYEHVLGAPLPERGARIEYASDAYLYLLAFISLGAWAFAAGSVFDNLIDRWIPSGLDDQFRVASFRTLVAGQLATLIVALPIYALVTRSINRALVRRPDLSDSGVRKWLTYLALVLTAACLIGDGIWFLTAFLTGELTIRFVLKTAVLFIISGSIFGYYLAGLRGRAVDIRRNRIYGGLAAGVAAAALALGFFGVGTPREVRGLALDHSREAALASIERAIGYDYLNNHRTVVPASLASLDLLPRTLLDPQTQIPYEYRTTSATRYELCATFDEPSENVSPRWSHGAGRACFARDATREP